MSASLACHASSELAAITAPGAAGLGPALAVPPGAAHGSPFPDDASNAASSAGAHEHTTGAPSAGLPTPSQSPDSPRHRQEDSPAVAATLESLPSLYDALAACDALQCRSPAESVGKNGEDLTPFHSSSEPPTTLAQYAHRVAYYAGYGVEGLCVGLALMHRYARATGAAPTRLMLHRLLLACVTVGAKAHFDKTTQWRVIALVGGVDCWELEAMELALLAALDYRVSPLQPAEVANLVAAQS